MVKCDHEVGFFCLIFHHKRCIGGTEKQLEEEKKYMYKHTFQYFPEYYEKFLKQALNLDMITKSYYF